MTHIRDLLSEGASGVGRRGLRSWISIAGVGVGVATLIAVSSLTQTYNQRLLNQLDSLAPTLLTASPLGVEGPEPPAITWDVDQQLARIEGVLAVGALAVVPNRAVIVDAPGLLDSGRNGPLQMDAVVATSGLLDVLQGELSQGRFFDAMHDYERYPVAVLGASAARDLKTGVVDGYASILVDDEPHVVLGILADRQQTSALSGSVILPASHSSDMGLNGPDQVYVRVLPGLTAWAAETLPSAIHPGSPDQISVFVSLPDDEIVGLVEQETNNLFLLLTAVALALATLTVGLTMLLTVLEQRTEIGLRRAIGATQWRIAGEYVVQSISQGVLGGLAGTAFGVLVTSVVAYFAATTPVASGMLLFAGTLVGAAAGLIAGVYPAIRAARVTPAEALRTV